MGGIEVNPGPALSESQVCPHCHRLVCISYTGVKGKHTLKFRDHVAACAMMQPVATAYVMKDHVVVCKSDDYDRQWALQFGTADEKDAAAAGLLEDIPGTSRSARKLRVIRPS